MPSLPPRSPREGSPRPRLAPRAVPGPECGPGRPSQAERPAGPSQKFGSPSKQILLPHPLEKLIWELGNEGFFSFSPSLLLIFCKASALRGVALSEARLHGRRGAQRLHQGTAPAGSGRPGTPTVGRGRSHQAELASPGWRRLPGAGFVRGEGWLPGLRDGDWQEGRAAGSGFAKVLARGEGDLAPDLGCGSGKASGVAEIGWRGERRSRKSPGIKDGNTGKARKVRPGFRRPRV